MIKLGKNGTQGNQTQRKSSITTLSTRTYEAMSEASATGAPKAPTDMKV
jgi:hypothetical protein